MEEITEKKESLIALVFDDIGSVIMNIDVRNVTPMQILAAAAYLDFYGKNALAQQENEKARQQMAQRIAVPNNIEIVGQGR